MSNSGVQPLYLRLQTLLPGQSVTLTATWNGIPSKGSPTVVTGTFTVTNQQAPAGARETFVIEPTPTAGTASPAVSPQANGTAHPVVARPAQTTGAAHPVSTPVAQTPFGVLPVAIATESVVHLNAHGRITWGPAA
jgi:hypothetical protein